MFSRNAKFEAENSSVLEEFRRGILSTHLSSLSEICSCLSENCNFLLSVSQTFQPAMRLAQIVCRRIDRSQGSCGRLQAKTSSTVLAVLSVGDRNRLSKRDIRQFCWVTLYKVGKTKNGNFWLYVGLICARLLGSKYRQRLLVRYYAMHSHCQCVTIVQ